MEFCVCQYLQQIQVCGMKLDETLRRVGQSLTTLVEQEIEARVDDSINEACEEARDEGYREGLESGKDSGYEGCKREIS